MSLLSVMLPFRIEHLEVLGLISSPLSLSLVVDLG